MESSTTNLTQPHSDEKTYDDVPLTMPVPQYPTLDNEPKRPVYKKQNKSFDALRNGQWSSFNASESKHKHFQFAEGDVPKSKVCFVFLSFYKAYKILQTDSKTLLFPH